MSNMISRILFFSLSLSLFLSLSLTLSLSSFNGCILGGEKKKRERQREREITRSEYQNSIGYFFPVINRSADIFPPKLFAEGLYLNKMCDLKYVSDEVGVVFYREVPATLGKPTLYDVVDLLGRKGNDPMHLCVTCSTKQQQVCHHEFEHCKFKDSESSVVGGLNQKTKIPFPMRFTGPQTGGQKHVKTGLFPCRVSGCFANHYQSAKSSNKHMLTHSFPKDPFFQLYRETVFYSSSESELIVGKAKGPGAYPCEPT